MRIKLSNLAFFFDFQRLFPSKLGLYQPSAPGIATSEHAEGFGVRDRGGSVPRRHKNSRLHRHPKVLMKSGNQIFFHISERPPNRATRSREILQNGLAPSPKCRPSSGQPHPATPRSGRYNILGNIATKPTFRPENITSDRQFSSMSNCPSIRKITARGKAGRTNANGLYSGTIRFTNSRIRPRSTPSESAFATVSEQFRQRGSPAVRPRGSSPIGMQSIRQSFPQIQTQVQTQFEPPFRLR